MTEPITVATTQPIINGRFANGLRVIDVLHVLSDCGAIAETAERCQMSKEEIKSAISYAMAQISYLQ